MLIEGPFDISLVENAETPGQELEIRFKAAFIEMTTEQQCNELSDYIIRLKYQVGQAGFDSCDGQGMQTILQFAQSMLPYIESGQAILDEPIVIEFQPEDPVARYIRTNLAGDPIVH